MAETVLLCIVCSVVVLFFFFLFFFFSSSLLLILLLQYSDTTNITSTPLVLTIPSEQQTLLQNKVLYPGRQKTTIHHQDKPYQYTDISTYKLTNIK